MGLRDPVMTVIVSVASLTVSPLGSAKSHCTYCLRKRRLVGQTLPLPLISIIVLGNAT